MSRNCPESVLRIGWQYNTVQLLLDYWGSMLLGTHERNWGIQSSSLNICNKILSDKLVKGKLWISLRFWCQLYFVNERHDFSESRNDFNEWCLTVFFFHWRCHVYSKCSSENIVVVDYHGNECNIHQQPQHINHMLNLPEQKIHGSPVRSCGFKSAFVFDIYSMLLLSQFFSPVASALSFDEARFSAVCVVLYHVLFPLLFCTNDFMGLLRIIPMVYNNQVFSIVDFHSESVVAFWFHCYNTQSCIHGLKAV